MPHSHAQLLDGDYRSANPFRTLLRLLDLRTWQGLAYFLVYLLKHAPMLMIPSYLEWVVNWAEDPSRHPGWYFPAITGGFALLLAQNIPTHQWFVRLTHTHVRGMEHRLRAALVRRLQQLSIGYHVRTDSGLLQAKVLRDVDSMVQMSTHLFHAGYSVLITLSWCLILTLIKDPVILIFFAIGGPIAAFMIAGFRRRMASHNQAYRQKMEQMSSRVSEMIDTIPVTRAHGAEDEEIERTDQYLGRVYDSAMRIDKTNQLFAAASWVVMQTAVLGAVALTAWMVVYHGIPLGRIMLYYGLFALVVGSLTQLLGFMPMISKGLDGLRSIGEVLECPDLEWNQGKRVIEEVAGAITFEDVHFTYESDKHALDGFSLHIEAGECVAFVGESGSGKSTAMNLAIGFFRPQAGRILLDGLDQRDIDMRSWRQFIAVVPQHTILFSGSLRENITYGREDIGDAAVQQAVDAAHLRDVVDDLPEGLDTTVGENGMTLSGGQRQRVAIARALVRDPRIIILDEATSALDVISEQQVQAAIDNLVTGRTVLIVAHRLSTIRRADRVVVMKRGRCIELGTQQELMDTEGEFSRLKRLQA